MSSHALHYSPSATAARLCWDSLEAALTPESLSVQFLLPLNPPLNPPPRPPPPPLRRPLAAMEWCWPELFGELFGVSAWLLALFASCAVVASYL